MSQLAQGSLLMVPCKIGYRINFCLNIAADAAITYQYFVQIVKYIVPKFAIRLAVHIKLKRFAVGVTELLVVRKR